MKNKSSIKNLKQIIILTVMIIFIGIITICFNSEIVNEKVAKVDKKTEEQVIKKTIDSETIIASYSPRKEVASQEVVSRYARARKIASYHSIEEITISKDMDLTQRCNVSKEDFIALIANSKVDSSGFFEENAGIIYDVCEKYELNEIFFCGLISAESGWDIAENHRKTHNYISLMSGNGLIQFSSIEEGLEKAAEILHNNYLSEKGSFYYGKTLSAVRTRFCPVNPNWTNLVYARMEQLVK